MEPTLFLHAIAQARRAGLPVASLPKTASHLLLVPEALLFLLAENYEEASLHRTPIEEMEADLFDALEVEMANDAVASGAEASFTAAVDLWADRLLKDGPRLEFEETAPLVGEDGALTLDLLGGARLLPVEEGELPSLILLVNHAHGRLMARLTGGPEALVGVPQAAAVGEDLDDVDNFLRLLLAQLLVEIVTAW